MNEKSRELMELLSNKMDEPKRCIDCRWVGETEVASGPLDHCPKCAFEFNQKSLSPVIDDLVIEISRKLGDSIGAPNRTDMTTAWFAERLRTLCHLVQKEGMK